MRWYNASMLGRERVYRTEGVVLRRQDLGEADRLTTIYTRGDNDTTPKWYLLPIIFDTLAREFAYPSDHQDKEWAALCGEVAQLLYDILGV